MAVDVASKQNNNLTKLKIKIMKKINLILVLTLLSIQLSLAQSPWTRDKGKAYVQLGLTGLYYNQTADENGKKQDLNENVADVSLQVYSEYGLTNKLTVNFILPYKSVSVENEFLNTTESHSGIGNVSLGLKYKLSDKNWKISSGIMISANTISKNKTNFIATGFNASTFLTYISIGKSKNKLYYYGNIGYGYMDNNYSDFFRFNGEIGYEVIPKGHIILGLETKNNISKESAFINDIYSNLSTSDRQNYNAIGIKLNYEFKKDKFGINLAGFGAFDIKNAPLALTLNLGLYAKL